MKTKALAGGTEVFLPEHDLEDDVKAIQEGLDAVDAGRVRPFEEFLAEHRRRFPDPVQVASLGLEDQR